MQFMPRMSAAERARMEREMNEVDPATGKTQRELMHEAILEAFPQTKFVDAKDVTIPGYVLEAQAKLNRSARPAPTQDDLRRLIADLLGE